MSAASPEFYRPSAPPASSPLLTLTTAGAGLGEDEEYYYSCRTPTGSEISYLREPTTCPPAPRKLPPCRKRLFQQGEPEPAILSLRLDELERIFRPQPPPPQCDKRPRRPAAQQQRKHSRKEA